MIIKEELFYIIRADVLISAWIKKLVDLFRIYFLKEIVFTSFLRWATWMYHIMGCATILTYTILYQIFTSSETPTWTMHPVTGYIFSSFSFMTFIFLNIAKSHYIESASFFSIALAIPCSKPFTAGNYGFLTKYFVRDTNEDATYFTIFRRFRHNCAQLFSLKILIRLLIRGLLWQQGLALIFSP